MVFRTLLPVTQPRGSDNPCTRIKMSQESATSTPVCKMVIQRCLRQSERSGGWNCRTLNPLMRCRTGDEMKALSPTAQYLSHYEQNTSAHKKSPQKRAFFNAWNPLKSRTARGLGFESTWAPCHGPSRFRLLRGCGTWAPPWCQRWRCGHGQWGIHLEKSDQIQPPKSALG